MSSAAIWSRHWCRSSTRSRLRSKSHSLKPTSTLLGEELTCAYNLPVRPADQALQRLADVEAARELDAPGWRPDGCPGPAIAVRAAEPIRGLVERIRHDGVVEARGQAELSATKVAPAGPGRSCSRRPRSRSDSSARVTVVSGHECALIVG